MMEPDSGRQRRGHSREGVIVGRGGFSVRGRVGQKGVVTVAVRFSLRNGILHAKACVERCCWRTMAVCCAVAVSRCWVLDRLDERCTTQAVATAAAVFRIIGWRVDRVRVVAIDKLMAVAIGRGRRKIGSVGGDQRLHFVEIVDVRIDNDRGGQLFGGLVDVPLSQISAGKREPYIGVVG